ncbi:amidase family protein [Parasphingorhabdus sp.]|uniref:amidase n=1 Tax=Parasphingorhabdus sp. TaxID=2709688 RepID=UPI003262FB98
MIQWDDLETANAALNAFVDFDEDAQFGEGPLDDMTIGIKANIAVEGLPWTGGIEAYRTRIASKDADAVARLRAAGAAIIGTVNMEEAALGAKTDNPFFGATQNPHQIGYTPGGSSGGSAAAVAAGLCDVTLGTDTMGSVRIPASYCGIYGLKPTHGAISQDGLEIAEATLDSIGPMARSLEALEACSRVLMPLGKEQVIDNIILLENLGDVQCEAAVLENYANTCQALNAVDNFSLPYPLTRIRYAGFILTSLALSETLGALIETKPEGLSDSLKFLLSFGPQRSPSDLAEDRKILAEVSDVVNAVVAKHGAILMPTAPQAAFSHADKAPANQADFTCLANIAGLPAISIPAGRNAEGLPVGVQIISAAGNEAGLLKLTKKLDGQLSAYHQPPLFYRQ